MKKCISCCLSHQNPATYLFRAVLSCKRCLIWCRFLSWFRPEHFFTGGSVMNYGLIFYVKNVLMLDLFHLLSSPDVNWWTGVVWITCGLLWCFYQLFGLSFWRHPFTAEHPLLRHWCRDTFLQTWWRNKLILILDDLRVNTFTANLTGLYIFLLFIVYIIYCAKIKNQDMFTWDA